MDGSGFGQALATLLTVCVIIGIIVGMGIAALLKWIF